MTAVDSMSRFAGCAPQKPCQCCWNAVNADGGHEGHVRQGQHVLTHRRHILPCQRWQGCTLAKWQHSVPPQHDQQQGANLADLSLESLLRSLWLRQTLALAGWRGHSTGSWHKLCARGRHRWGRANVPHSQPAPRSNTAPPQQQRHPNLRFARQDGRPRLFIWCHCCGN